MKVPANSVPAAAVIQKGQVLFGIIGRKWRVGCTVLFLVTGQPMWLVWLLSQPCWSLREERRISSVEVKFLDIRRNT